MSIHIPLLLLATLLGVTGCTAHRAGDSSAPGRRSPDVAVRELNISVSGEIKAVRLRDPLGRTGAATETNNTTIPGFQYGTEPRSVDPGEDDVRELIVLVVPEPLPGEYVLTVERLEEGGDEVAVGVQAAPRGGEPCAGSQIWNVGRGRESDLRFELRWMTSSGRCEIEIRE